MVAETMNEVMFISLSRKSGKDILEESRMGLEENFPAKHYFLSAADN